MKNQKKIIVIIICIMFIVLSNFKNNDRIYVEYVSNVPSAGLDHAQTAQSSLMGRIEQQVNKMDGISSSDITSSDENTISVQLTLYPDTEFTAANEDNIKNYIQRATSIEKDSILITVLPREE